MSKISVRIVPNASRAEIVGKELGAWKIRLPAAPVDGKANEALIEFLSEILDIPKSSIAIEKGHTSKTKILSVNLPIAHIEELLAATK